MTVIIASDTLERLRNSLSLPQREWVEKLSLTQFQYAEAIAGPFVRIAHQSVEDLADELEVLPTAIISGDLDFTMLARRYSGNPVTLPEVYSKGAYSRLRTSVHLLDYIEARCGWRARNQILRRFQLNESTVEDPDMKISVRFISDLCEYLESAGISRSVLFEMGKASVVANYSSTLGNQLRAMKDPKRVMELCFAELINRYYDENFVYRLIRLGETSCTVEAQCHEQAKDGVGQRILGNGATCAARAGTFSSLTGYLNLPYATVRETACIHRGDPRCRYEIDFGHAREISA